MYLIFNLIDFIFTNLTIADPMMATAQQRTQSMQVENDIFMTKKIEAKEV